MIVYGLRPAATFADRPFDASLLGSIASEADRNARRSSGYGETVRARTVRYVDAQVLPGRHAGPAEDPYAEVIAEALNPAAADVPAPAEAEPGRRTPAPRSLESQIAKKLLKGYDQAAWQGAGGIREWGLRNGWAAAQLPQKRIILEVLYAWIDTHPHLRKTNPYAGQKRGPRNRNRGART